MTTKMAIFAYDGCLSTSVTGPTDIFHIANIHQRIRKENSDNPLFSWKIYSPDGKPVHTSTGITIAVDGHYNQAGNPDLCLIPGIDHAFGSEVTNKTVEMRSTLGHMIKHHHSQGAVIASNCSGSFLLADTGLLDGKEATTSWWLAHHFSHSFPKVRLQLEKMVTEHNNIFCSGAMTAYMHLCIRLIEKFAGESIAKCCAKTVMLQNKETTQAPYIPVPHHFKQKDELIRNAVKWMQENLDQDFHLDNLASQLAVSPRTFIRRFNQATGKPPKQYFQKLRIDEAKRLLESTQLSVDDITEKVGYVDVSSFRRLFKREVALSPTEYRKRFTQ
ncbi:helix-turn-helix domain-containing protein [Ketobacter sp. MCCC 1A13808]|uniref:GlxA family transcriptional regulator n=1 Tax=Ketobacter sp. MCCC 1A13808 TaxID=2602738 RepID=UPI000F1D13AE|nr:helix-turn-helix domain-containing protein [Ketobacter sp. MCCC 1A13808]MVF12859.1 helix-turn-helix domain-containing protein [Ketobacter sp. MCCC 1A13808]RLP54467.1 MAG: helix-turn-helix domain-containing protein [Ketobacter sp.]